MTSHHATPTFTCPICSGEKPTRTAVHGEMVTPAIVTLIQRERPAWALADPICADCLSRFRSEYVEDVLETDRGELSRLEQDVVASLREEEILSADLNAQFAQRLTLGQRVADRVATFGGSWAFLGTFALVMLVWMSVNSFALLRRPFDPFPFILLNLVLSCLAAVQAPVIMMSQNRQESKDRLRSENDYRVNLKAELEIRHLNEKMDLLLSRQWNRLIEIQRIQLEMMQELARPHSR